MLTRKVKLLKAGPLNSTKFVLGQTGCGKSTLIANMLQEESRFVVFDTRNEYYSDFFAPPASEANNPGQLIDYLNNGIARIIYKFPAGDWEVQLDALLGLIY